MLLLFRIFSLLPLWLAHMLGAALGWVVWLASPTYRRRFIDNSAQAGYRLPQVLPAIGHAGRMVAELPRMWLHPEPHTFIVRTTGTDTVQAAWDAGRGIIFLTPHLGCFELSVQGAARLWAAAHGPITVLYRPARQPWLAAMMRTVRNRDGIEAVPTTLSGVRHMLKALRSGRAVGLLPDQVPPQDMGMWVPFFGRDAYTMTLAARLALQTGAAIVLARCERLSWGQGYALHFSALADAVPGPLPKDLEAATAHISLAMQTLIRQSPQQYLWGYGRYKQPRTLPPAEASSKEGAPP